MSNLTDAQKAEIKLAAHNAAIKACHIAPETERETNAKVLTEWLLGTQPHVFTTRGQTVAIDFLTLHTSTLQHMVQAYGHQHIVNKLNTPAANAANAAKEEGTPNLWDDAKELAAIMAKAHDGTLQSTPTPKIMVNPLAVYARKYILLIGSQTGAPSKFIAFAKAINDTKPAKAKDLLAMQIAEQDATVMAQAVRDRDHDVEKSNLVIDPNESDMSPELAALIAGTA